MAKESDQKAGALDADKPGLLPGLFAEENAFDRRALWRIGSWGVAAVGAVALAAMANQSSLGWRREQLAAADLARQAQQIQVLAKESQHETRRLASAIDTLNSDRDRLFSRVTVVEQGLESVTGTIAKQAAAAKPVATAAVSPAMTTPLPAPADGPAASPDPAPSPAAPVVAPVATAAPAPAPDKPRGEPLKPELAPAVPLPQITSNPPPSPAPVPAHPALGSQASMMGPPDPAAPKLVEPKPAEPARTGSINPAPSPASAPTPEVRAAVALNAGAEARPEPPKDQDKAPIDADAGKATIQRTEFAVDLGGANSIPGLRALWRGLLKSNNAELAELRPIIVLREGNTGLGMQLRLAAGPLHDAAEAAKICAALSEGDRTCETTVFDGQRLAMGTDEPSSAARAKQQPATKPAAGRRFQPKHAKQEDPPAPPPKPETSTFSSLFGGGKH